MIFTSAPSATNRLKFIPVRGRKQHFHRPDFLRCRLKFIPVRGRKPGHATELTNLPPLKYIPVRGRKPNYTDYTCTPFG